MEDKPPAVICVAVVLKALQLKRAHCSNEQSIQIESLRYRFVWVP